MVQRVGVRHVFLVANPLVIGISTNDIVIDRRRRCYALNQARTKALSTLFAAAVIRAYYIVRKGGNADSIFASLFPSEPAG